MKATPDRKWASFGCQGRGGRPGHPYFRDAGEGSYVFPGYERPLPDVTPRTHGFSLIELIIVMAILGTLLGIASYSWSRYTENSRLKTAVREVIADLEFARERAKGEGITYTVTFTEGSANYTISNGTTTQTKSLSAIGANITVESTNFNGEQVQFLPRGTLAGNTGKIVINNQRGSKGTITINVTGRIYASYTLQ